MQSNGRYEDILHQKRPPSSRHRPMAQQDRAAQFSPFAALVGLDAAISETARIRTQQVERDAYADEMLAWDLHIMQQQWEDAAFDPDESIPT